MTSASLRSLAACLAAVAVAGGAVADDSGYEVEQGQSPLSLRALIDVRAVRQGPQPSWLEGGPGKTRYGGVLENGEAETVARFALSQFILEPAATLPWGLRAQAQLDWDIDIAVNGDFGAYSKAPRLVEAFLRREWGDGESGWAAQAGVMNPPFSLESDGPAWTPRLTLTPSALNSWLWEEGRPVGLEGEWWREARDAIRVSAFGGLGWGPDQMGILLAERGWVLSDYQSGINGDLPIPATGGETSVFDERDGRPALYAGAAVSDPSHVVELRLGYFDNLGDLATTGVWETRFAQAGMVLEPVAGLELMMQGLLGMTVTRGAPLESRFSAWYPLASYRYREHRVAVRYDNFHVNDLDGGPPSTEETGYAITFAYLYEFWLRHRLGFEYIYVDSSRPGSLPDRMAQGGWQLSYRFRY